MEKHFLKMPSGKEGRTVVRKKSDMSEKKFENLKEHHERSSIWEKTGDLRKFFEKHEQKPTNRQREIMNFVIEEFNKMTEEYGIDPVKASKDQLRLVDDEFFDTVHSKKGTMGTAYPTLQQAVIRCNESITDSQFAEVAYHELVHLFAFNRVVIQGADKFGNPVVTMERSGIASAVKGDRFHLYYNQINEAITQELTMRFWEKMRESVLFKEDYWKLKEKFGKNAKEAIFGSIRNKDGEWENSPSRTYAGEHKKTMFTFDHIYEKNKDQFQSSEEVSQMFARAYFSGKLLPIARLIEKTYGKGAFRGIGIESSSKFAG